MNESANQREVNALLKLLDNLKYVNPKTDLVREFIEKHYNDVKKFLGCDIPKFSVIQKSPYSSSYYECNMLAPELSHVYLDMASNEAMYFDSDDFKDRYLSDPFMYMKLTDQIKYMQNIIKTFKMSFEEFSLFIFVHECQHHKQFLDAGKPNMIMRIDGKEWFRGIAYNYHQQVPIEIDANRVAMNFIGKYKELDSSSLSSSVERCIDIAKVIGAAPIESTI